MVSDNARDSNGSDNGGGGPSFGWPRLGHEDEGPGEVENDAED